MKKDKPANIKRVLLDILILKKKKKIMVKSITKLIVKLQL